MTDGRGSAATRVPGNALRYPAALTALLIVVCAAVAVFCISAVNAGNAALEGRSSTSATVRSVDNGVAAIEFDVKGSILKAQVSAPTARTGQTTVFYRPADPANDPLIGASPVLLDASRGVDQLAALAVVVVAAVAYAALAFWRSFHVGNGQLHEVTVRRVRVQRGLTSRSWIEVTGRTVDRWVPVFFDPMLVTMPSPTRALAQGGAISVGGRTLRRSGATRTEEPAGVKKDNPTSPDAVAVDRAKSAAALRRRLLLDGVFAVPAPFVALLWVYVAGGGLPSFVGCFVVAAAVGVWLSAIRGSDPS